MRLPEEITFVIEKDRESGWFVASWDDPAGGGITTQGKDLAELQANLKEAVQCHFESGNTPKFIRLHFVDDPVLMAV
jgi:predicted RNase H-like HicB family nuclease